MLERFAFQCESACASETDETGRNGRQRLRPWLESIIEGGTIPGLNWIGGTKTKFRIPWKHGGKRDWTPESSRVFMEWAKYTGRYREGVDEPDYAVWKTRLRCAFNKAPDIEELKEESCLDCPDPFRVYILKPRKFPNRRRYSPVTFEMPRTIDQLDLAGIDTRRRNDRPLASDLVINSKGHSQRYTPLMSDLQFSNFKPEMEYWPTNRGYSEEKNLMANKVQHQVLQDTESFRYAEQEFLYYDLTENILTGSIEDVMPHVNEGVAISSNARDATTCPMTLSHAQSNNVFSASDQMSTVDAFTWLSCDNNWLL